MLSRSCSFTLYVSSTLQSVSLLTLSKAFSWSTKARFSSRLYSIAFSLSCHGAKMASVHPLPFLKPICTSLSNGFTLYLVRCSRIFAYNFPVWLRRDIPCMCHSRSCCLSLSRLVQQLHTASLHQGLFSPSRPSGIL